MTPLQSSVSTILILVIAAAGIAALTVNAGAQESATNGSASTKSSADADALAAKLVRECAAVGEGEKVWISGGVRDLELLENLAVHVRARGAHPLLTLESDRMSRRLYDDVPAKYDTQERAFDIALAKMIDAAIWVDATESQKTLAGVPAERIADRAKAFEPVGKALHERGVRRVNLGNGLYPTEERARRFGIGKGQLSKIFWAGVNVDYARLQQRADSVRQALASGRQLKIKHSNGTDFTVGIEGRPVLVSDGVISAEEMKKGGAATETWLPAGEVFLAPVPGTAEGKIVVNRHFYQGERIRKLKMTFSAGRLTGLSAESGLGPLKALYDASGEGRDQFGAIDIGVNPKVTIPADSKMTAWMASGMVSVGIGNNEWAGGDNDSAFGLYTHLPGATLKVDGKTIVEDGNLK